MTLGIVVAAARMAPLAFLALAFAGLSARLVAAALFTALALPVVKAQPVAVASVPAELVVGTSLGLIAALPFYAARAAGATLRPLGAAYGWFALALFGALDGPRRVAIAASKSYLVIAVGSLPSSSHVLGLGAELIGVALALAAPLLAATLVAELAVLFVARAEPALGGAAAAAPLRAVALVLAAAAAVYASMHALLPTLGAAANLTVFGGAP